jgi:hypothetical protein
MNPITAPSLMNVVFNTISNCVDTATRIRINIFFVKPVIPALLLSFPFSVFLLFLKVTANIIPLIKSTGIYEFSQEKRRCKSISFNPRLLKPDIHDNHIIP